MSHQQVLWNNAQVIAHTYPTALQDEYISAATTLRVPYWDWVEHPYLLDAASQPSVTITTPDGEATLSNPLYAYVFLDTPEDEGIPLGYVLANMTETVRWWSADTQQSNQTAANATLQANAPNIKSAVYQMLTTPTDYSAFSCVMNQAADQDFSNIENIHNGIHSFVGGNGHMSYPELSAFDPIFFLHHANVDRLFAMWQVLNPDNYVVPTANTYGSYYELPGFVDSANSSTSLFPRSQ
jgi:tyrosinase